MRKVVVFLAPGFEEIEALTPVDYLRRADCEVTTLATATSGRTVESSHKIPVIADMTLDSYLSSNAELPDAVVVPGGGPGSRNISECQMALKFIQQMHDAGKIVSAICASPARVLSKTTVLEGKKWTCYLNMEDEAGKYKAGHTTEAPVIVDGNVVTSRGAGTSEQFAMELVKILCGTEVYEKVKASTIQR